MSNDFSNQENVKTRFKILLFIHQYLNKCPYSPSTREISSALSISTTDVHHHIDHMERIQLITSAKLKNGTRRSGTIRLTGAGLQELKAHFPSPFSQDNHQETVSGSDPHSTEETNLPPPPDNHRPSHKRVLDVSYVILSARISDHKAVRTVTIPVLNLISASFGTETHSSDYSLSGLGSESFLNINQDMIPTRLKIEDLFALEVKGDSMIEAGIDDGDYVILQQTQTAENGDMCAVWIDEKEATLKYFYREEKRIRLEPANAKIAPMLIGPRHKVSIQGKVVLVVRL